MRLETLVGEAAAREPLLLWDTGEHALDGEVHALRLDSRKVGPGDLFLCVPGSTTDGHRYAAQAASRGAVALVVERWVDVDIPQIRVTTVRRAMAWLAAVFNGDPSRELQVVGITGTNGKSTTAHLVKAILDHAGRPSGLVGTLTGARTTPEAPHLQASLRSMVDDGQRAVAMEVSSHALAQDRVLGVHFDVGVFTNLSPDHLDYHPSIDDYFEAKAKLFRAGLADAAVLNESDPYGRRLLEELDMACVPYSLDMVTDVDTRLDGSAFTWRDQRVELALPGLFNIENAVAAAEAVRLLQVADPAIAAGLSAAGQVAGRFEVVTHGHPDAPTVIVDYSHTPAGIEQVLRSVAAIAPAATRCVVFGAGGDRDREKRPLMGAAAEAFAHDVIVTSDNPRSEDPAAIIADIVVGMTRPDAAGVEPDRRRAIELALSRHGPEDVIVVAGKGHETTQIIGGRVLDFDDRDVVRDVVAAGAPT